MTAWVDFEGEQPEFAGRVRSRFELATHNTIATLRRDGSPRISGTELKFEKGEITIGIMGQSLKLADVRRDPRVAVHSSTIDSPTDGTLWPGDAKFAGRLIEMPPPSSDDAIDGAGYFRVELTEVTLTVIGDPADHLIIETWHPGSGLQRHPRY